MLLVVTYNCYLPSADELKFVRLTISAAGDGTYKLSVKITHGSGEGSYFVTLVGINDNTTTRQAYGTVFTNLPGGEEYRVVVTWENLGKVLKSIQTQAIIPDTSEQSSMKFDKLKIFPDKLNVKTSGTGKYLISLWNIKDNPKDKTRKLLRKSKAVFQGLSGGEKYKLFVIGKVAKRTKASIKTFVVTPH